MDIFKYTEYQKFIKDRLESSKKSGLRTQLAKAAGCSSSWITRVLSEQVQLTPDQALGICNYFFLSDHETDYFLLLVEFQRTATDALRKRIQLKLTSLRKTSRNFENYVKTDSTLSKEYHIKYYSSWIFSAIHVACIIRPFSVLELEKIFKIPVLKTSEILIDLKEMGLIKTEGGKWISTSKAIHLPSDSPLANIAHGNWRNRSIQILQEGTSDGLHYSAIHCLSKNDVEIVLQKLKTTILNCRKIIENSSSETLAVLCLDWYEQK